MQNRRTIGLTINKNDSYVNIGNKSRNTILIVFSSLIGSLNVLFSTNYIVSMIIVAIELAILLYFFLKNEITRYIGCYLIFLCLSFEFDLLVGSKQFYGFKNFHIFGVNLGIMALLPVLAIAIFRKIKIKRIKKDFYRLYKFIIIIIFMNISGFMFGLFQILINDNKILSMDGVLGNFMGVNYSMIGLPCLMIVAIIYLLTWEEEKLPLLENYLISILIGIVVSMIVSLATENFGQYGGVDTLLVTNVMQYIPFMLIFVFYKKYESSKKVLIFGIIGAILSLRYNASGKIVLVYMMIPIAICVMLWSKKKVLPLMVVFLITPVVVFFIIKVVEIISSNSVLLISKLTEALSILKFWDSNWLSRMPLSPRTRIVEFISIVHEYLEKPWFLIFGKGYMGTITDYTGFFGAKFVPDAFSMSQWSNGTFYALHETINILFLYNGLLGVSFYLYMIKIVFKNFTKSPWVLIGGYWFLMFYGYSVTMSAFGIAALLLGYYKIENCNSYKHEGI